PQVRASSCAWDGGLEGWSDSRSFLVRSGEVGGGWVKRQKTLVALGAYRCVCDVVALAYVLAAFGVASSGGVVCVGCGLQMRLVRVARLVGGRGWRLVGGATAWPPSCASCCSRLRCAGCGVWAPLRSACSGAITRPPGVQGAADSCAMGSGHRGHLALVGSETPKADRRDTHPPRATPAAPLRKG